ncbi:MULTISPECIES: hypothetical protein [Streptomyces]|uniref:DUF1795 domain-containing protein n=1 Tax=Streptomyces luteosporeus TaxID=173856 RepID=A0ABN3TPE0_9ACTN
MAATLPVPIEFRLPAGWRPTDVDGRAAAEVAFAAVHPEPADGFTANITISGEYRSGATTLTELADDSVERLRRLAESVVVAQRHEIGPLDTPALTQRLVFSVRIGDAYRDLVQSQVYLCITDVLDSHRWAVVRLALTAAASQHDDILEEFQGFVRTVRLTMDSEA